MTNEINDRIARLSLEGVDVLILGAGINGAGLFRDLCEQGVNCLIVDKADFGSGTSAAPSRLIHGGLKYLETGEFGLVAQSTLERNLLLRNAPHCVEPLPTVIPIFSWTRGIWAALRTLMGSTRAPRSRGAILIKIGLALYDFYGSRSRMMPRHTLVGKRRALRDLPQMTDRIVAAGTYYDAKISRPERLVYELVQDGLKANAMSAAVNFTALTSAEDGAITFEQPDGHRFSVRPKLVVNAAGPWIDRVNALLGAETKMIGGTKGSHILLDHDDLVKSLDGRMIYFEADDGRICLVFSYLGRALIGSTDIPATCPENVRCEDWEIDYFLDSVRSLLPGFTFDRSQIVYTYAGIRPLPASNAAEPGLISRDHSAPVIDADAKRPYAIISLVGGKWTTFRGFAEEVTDTVLDRLDYRRTVSTRALAIGGGQNFPKNAEARADWIAETAALAGISRERADQLLTRYGTTARALTAHRSKWKDADRLPDATGYSLAEIDWIARNEMIVHLTDIVMRRTTLAFVDKLTVRDIQAIANVAGVALHWDGPRVEAEIALLTTSLVSDHGVVLKPVR